MNIYIDERL